MEVEDGYWMIDDARGQRQRRDMEKKKIIGERASPQSSIMPPHTLASRKDPVIQLDRRDHDEISNVPLLALSLLACYFPLPCRVDECF